MTPLETIVLSPTTSAKSTVIWLHGLGADGHDFVDIVPELHLPEELAVRFIFPHAPIRPVTLNGGFPMRAWFDIYNLTTETEVDMQGLKATDKELHALIQHEHAQGIPFEKIFLAGFSQGGSMALYTGLTYPKKLGGIIALSTFLPLHQPLKTTQSQRVPIFMAHGEHDAMVSPVWGRSTKEYLQDRGYTIEWHTYPMAHTVSMAEIHDIAAWLKPLLQVAV